MVKTTETDELVQQAAASSVASLFLLQARVHPDRPALVEGDRRLSYGEVGRQVAALAGWLRSHGVGQGDRVAILSENRLEYLDRKSTRLNSSYSQISYAVFCLKKKKMEA